MRWVQAAVAALLFVVIVLWGAATARAEEPTQADEQAAKAHFLAGSAYYEQGNYTDAVKEFSEAHRLSHRADLLYNISVCYERLGRWDDAISSLQQYLTERPEAPDRGVIESRIANFSQRREADRASPPSTTTAPAAAALSPVVPPPARPRHTLGFVVGGIGLGLLVVALGTGVAAHLAYNDLDMSCPKQMCDGTKQTLRDEASIGHGLAISTDVLLGVGGAALVTGVVLFILESRRSPAVRVQLAAPPGGAAVQF
jgi:tetratricopeptide (TPR) repeat protein